MDPEFQATPNRPTPSQSFGPPTIPSGDDAALQAIEALEAESNVLDETYPDALSPTEPPINGSFQGPATPISATPTSIASLDTPEPLAPRINPAEAPSAIAQSLSDTLKNAPDAPTPVNVFGEGNKKPKKSAIIALVIVLIIGLGVGGYFAYQHFIVSNQITTSTTPAPEEETTPEASSLTDNADAVNTEAAQMETTLTGIDDSAYDDTTLSDKTLYE